MYWGGPPLGVQILYTFPTPKTGIKQIEQFNDIILRILRSRLESQSWTSFNSFPIVNEVSAGVPVPTPPDSGKTPQLRTSKLAQNCGKTEILHLQPSYRICWSHEIETLPPMWTKDSSGFKYILLFFNRMILHSGRHTRSDPQSCRVRSLGGQRGGAQKQTTHQETKTKLSSAMPNRDQTIHCQGKRRKRHPASNVAAESAPHPRHAAKACDNNFGKDWQHALLLQAGLETFNQQTFPGILKLALVSWKWHGGLYKIWRLNDWDLLSGYIVGVACLHWEIPCRRICIHLASRTSWSSILYPSFLFATLCSSSFCCIFTCTNPKQTLLCGRCQPSKPLDLPGSATRTSSLRNKTVHTKQVSRSQSSATFTAHKRRCLCTCCFVSLCWRVTSLTQNADECRMLTSLCQRSQKLAKRMSNLEIFTSWHGLFVKTCLSVWKTWKHFKHQRSHPKTCCLRLSNKDSANATFSFMMSPSDLLATQVLNAFRTLHNSFIIERHTKLPQVQTEFSVAKTKVKEMENVSVFHFIPHIQSCIAFSMQPK